MCYSVCCPICLQYFNAYKKAINSHNTFSIKVGPLDVNSEVSFYYPRGRSTAVIQTTSLQMNGINIFMRSIIGDLLWKTVQLGGPIMGGHRAAGGSAEGESSVSAMLGQYCNNELTGVT